MTKSPRKPPRFLKRPARGLPSSLEHSLSAYALAATAAGVGVIALAPPGEAKIIYTPAHEQLMNRGQVLLDLNHDGTNDFSFYGSSFYRYFYDLHHRLTAYPGVKGNAIWGAPREGHVACAARLSAGTQIGPQKPFQANSVNLFLAFRFGSDSGSYCPWLGNTKQGGTGYLRLKFLIKGEIHFGWARLTVTFPRKTDGTFLTGFAYETIPNKAIIAGKTKGADDAEPTVSLNTRTGQPVTLGALALGAPALSIWRREDSVAATLERN